MPTLTQITEGETILVYALQTEPTPVQVSPASGPPSLATLRFVITAPLNVSSVVVKHIVFTLPIGDPSAPDSNDLTETATGISPSVSSSGPDKWSLAAGPKPGVFVLTPADNPPVPIISQGLTVEFTGIQVSPIVGTAQVKIAETTDQAAPQPRQCSIAVPKFPLGFSAGNFSPEAPMVSNGSPAVLTWNGSTQALYTMLWGSQSRIVSDVRRWTSPPLTDATTFILQVAAQQGGQTVVLHFSATVIVAHPSLVARDLTVLTTSNLGGAVTVGTTPAPANLTVSGIVSGPTVNAGAVTATSTLTVNGTATIANLIVGHQLTANSQVSLFHETHGLDRGQYTVHTDGLVLGYITSIHDTTKKCWGKISGMSTLGGVMAVGGVSMVSMIGEAPQPMFTPGNFLLPVQKDQSFSIWDEAWPGSEVAPWVRFIWIPFGNPNPGQPTFRKVSDSIPAQ